MARVRLDGMAPQLLNDAAPPRRGTSTARARLLHDAAPPRRGSTTEWHLHGVEPRGDTTVAGSDLGLTGLDMGSGVFLLLKNNFWCRLT
jgi:hypothetical protein